MPAGAYPFVRPLLFALDPERAHAATTAMLKAADKVGPAAALLRRIFAYENKMLRVRVGDLDCSNPIGLAAGFDKHGELVSSLRLLGFGHIEVGTVTPRSQPGNDKPRLFRLPEDEALINRMGFNSHGMHAAARNLGRASAGLTVGVNIGKNRDTPLERAADDYAEAFRVLAPLADYVVVNVSSPNTPGLRKLQERQTLEELIRAVAAANAGLSRARPIFVKVSPDESPRTLDGLIEVALQSGIAGFVATNTSVDRRGLRGRSRAEAGGLSGRPLRERSRHVISHIYRVTGGRLPIIGAGGIFSAVDAYRHVRAGASMVQLYTGLIYKGPALVKHLKVGLVELLARDGFSSVQEAIGAGT